VRRAEERDKPAVTEQIIVLFFIAFVIFLFFQVIAFLGACPGLIKGLGLEAYRAFSFSSLSQLAFSLGGFFVCGGAAVMRARSTRRQWQTRCGLMRR
jgi:hypothetical protein